MLSTREIVINIILDVVIPNCKCNIIGSVNWSSYPRRIQQRLLFLVVLLFYAYLHRSLSILIQLF